MSYRCYICKRTKDEEGQLLEEELCRRCQIEEKAQKKRLRFEAKIEKVKEKNKGRVKSREEVEGEKEWRKDEDPREWTWSGEFDEAMVNESEEMRIRQGVKRNLGGGESSGTLQYSEMVRSGNGVETKEEKLRKQKKEVEELEKLQKNSREELEKLEKTEERRKRLEELEREKKEQEDLKERELETKRLELEQLIKENEKEVREILKITKRAYEAEPMVVEAPEETEMLVEIQEEVSLSPVREKTKEEEKQEPVAGEQQRGEKRRVIVRETREQQSPQRRRTHQYHQERPPPPPPTHYYSSRQVEKFCLDKYDDKLSKTEKAANESIRRDVFEDKEVVQHGRDLMTVSKGWMEKKMREARTREDVIAIMKFIEIQIGGQRAYLVEKIKEECERLVSEGEMPPGRGHGHYKSDMRGNKKFLGWYVQEIRVLRETAEEAERIPPEMLVAGMLGLTRLCTLHNRFAVFR
ncbi:trichohyalin-like [Bolinopsis microptera]|uniref:trichohyalin-like n=1 Tax=Bolinopsis microptera TaxID=2820187 RepID=UPI003079BE51